MGKSKRLKAKRKQSKKGFLAEFSDRLTENFQRELRNSEMWEKMVAEFGEERAQQILRECKADVKPGFAPHESRDRTKDIS
jgi:hypothetical protein